jgi:hypothetical protein
MYDPIVLRTKSSFMQAAADAVRQGYHWHVSGIVSMERASALAMKFAHLYLCHLDKDKRYRRRKSRLGNARLLLWQPNLDVQQIAFTLLITDGDHPAHVTEPGLRDARDRASRLCVTDYELVFVCRPGVGHPVLTWRMSKALIEFWEHRFRDLIRRHAMKDLALAWNSLHKVPGFGPIRSEAKRLARDAEATWSRTMKGSFPKPRIRIGYIQRVPHVGLPLSAVIRRSGQTDPLI